MGRHAYSLPAAAAAPLPACQNTQAGFNTQLSWSFVQLVVLHYQWPFPLSHPALSGALGSGNASALAEGLASLITTDSIKAAVAVPNLPSPLPPDYSPGYTGAWGQLLPAAAAGAAVTRPWHPSGVASLLLVHPGVLAASLGCQQRIPCLCWCRRGAGQPGAARARSGAAAQRLPADAVQNEGCRGGSLLCVLRRWRAEGVPSGCAAAFGLRLRSVHRRHAYKQPP